MKRFKSSSFLAVACLVAASCDDSPTEPREPAPTCTFCIEIRFVGSVSAAHEAAFANARLRWQEIITGDLPSVLLNIPAGDCKDPDGNVLVDHPAINETIDDLLVYVQIEEIDGQGQVLGSAGPCYVRGTGRLPLFGIMRFDSADLNDLDSKDMLHDVILHELGHVLGFPTVWKEAQFSLLEGEGTDNPYFKGSNTASRFQLAGGTLVNGVGVPVENTGGTGTRDSHWRESVFGTELMSGFITTGSNHLSVITIASMQDLGYQVNFGAADAYVLPGQGGPRSWSSVRSAPLEMVERPMAPPRVVH
jgi:hypothetical protein